MKSGSDKPYGQQFSVFNSILVTRYLLLSFFLHVLIVAAAFVIARHSNLYKIPPAYIVTIVDSVAVRSQQSEDRDSTPQDVKPKTQSMDIPSKLKDISKKDEMAVKEQIEALQAKKRIEKMAALRKMVDIKNQEAGVKGQDSKLKTQNPSGGDYYSLVIDKIRQQWIFPERIDKDLLAIITIKIARDGSVTIGRMEQSSGNALFDRSALRAINKASPLPPPPQEIEIGVRFRP